MILQPVGTAKNIFLLPPSYKFNELMNALDLLKRLHLS